MNRSSNSSIPDLNFPTTRKRLLDIGGRPHLQYETDFQRRECGELDTDVLEDFFQGFASSLGATVSVKAVKGRSDHHKIEALFKAFAKAMKMACSTDPRAADAVPSTKGIIEDI